MVRVVVGHAKPRRATFYGCHNATKARALILLENDRLKGGRGLTWRELHQLGASTSFYSIGVLLSRWTRWRIVLRGRSNKSRIYRYRISAKGRGWLYRHAEVMSVDTLIQDIQEIRGNNAL